MSIQVIQSASILLENNGHHGPTRNDGIYQQQQQQHHTSSSSSHDINIMTITNMYTNTNTPPCFLSSLVLDNNNNNNYREGEERQEQEEEEEEEVGGGERKRRREQQHQEEEEEEREYQVKLGGLLITAIRRSVLGCSSSCDTIINTRRAYMSGMEIGVPTNVRHVAHVTFDRFNGFLGLPVEFEPDVPRRPPSASTTVFGVSTNSMQLSYDTRGNSVPTILLLMQHRLYGLGGLQAEGIFRINPDNGQEEYVRDQLNRGLIPDDVDVHCLAGLIKAWFRELPTGVLDCLSPEQVMESQTEEECFHLAKLLPPTEAALLDWAVNLMADVAQFEHLNKMNARNVAMVFAPNMTHMADPLTALMHAVQVMNFLKTLIERTLKEREDSILDSALDSYSRDPSGDNGCHTPLQTIQEENNDSEPDVREDHTPKALNSVTEARQEASTQESKIITPEDQNKTKPSNRQKNGKGVQTTSAKKGPRKNNEKLVIQLPKSTEKTKGTILVSSVKLRNERVEAWR